MKWYGGAEKSQVNTNKSLLDIDSLEKQKTLL